MKQKIKGQIKIKPLKLPYPKQFYKDIYKTRTEQETREAIHRHNVITRLRTGATLEDWDMGRKERIGYYKSLGEDYKLGRLT